MFFFEVSLARFSFFLFFMLSFEIVIEILFSLLSSDDVLMVQLFFIFVDSVLHNFFQKFAYCVCFSPRAVILSVFRKLKIFFEKSPVHPHSPGLPGYCTREWHEHQPPLGMVLSHEIGHCAPE